MAAARYDDGMTVGKKVDSVCRSPVYVGGSQVVEYSSEEVVWDVVVVSFDVLVNSDDALNSNAVLCAKHTTNIISLVLGWYIT